MIVIFLLGTFQMFAPGPAPGLFIKQQVYSLQHFTLLCNTAVSAFASSFQFQKLCEVMNILP